VNEILKKLNNGVKFFLFYFVRHGAEQTMQQINVTEREQSKSRFQEFIRKYEIFFHISAIFISFSIRCGDGTQGIPK
jgi:hypothetical protein